MCYQRFAFLACFSFCLISAQPFVTDDEEKDFFKPKKKAKTESPTGAAELLRYVPKKFATFLSADTKADTVTLHLEDDENPTTWALKPDAEVKIHGWWGRLDQFQKGDRVWAWFHIGRDKEPKGIVMLADELSQQDIHGVPPTVTAIDAEAGTVTLKCGRKKGTRTLKLPKFSEDEGSGQVAASALKVGEAYYLQSAGMNIRTIIDEAELESLRTVQQEARRRQWIEEGLPGMVTFLHALSGEMDFMLDHEAIRWGRALKVGDKVTLMVDDPIEAEVKAVTPWRERTQLRLVVSGFALADLEPAQRVNLRVATPSAEVDASIYPPDIGQPRDRDERIEWFLASTYCTCKVAGDTCTGMFYTLSSCNSIRCGMPGHIRKKVAGMIDEGLDDQAIWDALRESQGPLMVKPHLLP